jgi:N-acetylmuramoyl-L-alanine amidase
MAGWYVVQEGDCLSSLAKQARLASWKKIYYHPDNADFRTLRPDPNVILPGDQIFIPDPEISDSPAATEKRHPYVVKKEPTKLRIVMADEDNQPYANCRYRLRVNAQLYEGTTDSQGLISEEIDAASQIGELTVWWAEAPALHCKWNLQIGHLDPVEHVKGVQGRLNNLGYNSGPVDGIVGPITTGAVRRFQEKWGLDVDGIAGPITKAKLKEVHGC